MVPCDAVAGIPWDEEMSMGARGKKRGGMGTPWPACKSGLGGGRRVTPIEMAPALRRRGQWGAAASGVGGGVLR